MDEDTNDAAEAIKGAQVRIRINHDKLAKGTWRHETTVEIVAADNPEAIERMLVEYERLTDKIGREENELRNDSDKFEQAA